MHEKQWNAWALQASWKSRARLLYPCVRTCVCMKQIQTNKNKCFWKSSCELQSNRLHDRPPGKRTRSCTIGPQGTQCLREDKARAGDSAVLCFGPRGLSDPCCDSFFICSKKLAGKIYLFLSSIFLEAARKQNFFFFTGNYKSTALMKNTRLSFILCQGDTEATWLLWHCPLGHANTQQKTCFPLEWIVYKISHCLENPTLCGYCPITVMAIPFAGLAHHSYGDLLVTVFEIPTMKTSFINFPSLLAYKWPNKVIHGSSVSIS